MSRPADVALPLVHGEKGRSASPDALPSSCPRERPVYLRYDAPPYNATRLSSPSPLIEQAKNLQEGLHRPLSSALPLPSASVASPGHVQRHTYHRIMSDGTNTNGEIVQGDSWRRHTKVFGGNGACLACEENNRKLST